MRIKIVAGGIYDGEGKEVPVGTELDVADYNAEKEGKPHPWAGRFETISGGSTDGKTFVAGDAAPQGPFTVKDDGKGWFGIYDAAGAKVGKGIREDDAKAFQELTPEDQAELAAEHGKA